MANDFLQSNIQSFPMVGEVYAAGLKKLGIATIGDLLHHYPFRYDDLSLTTSIDSLKDGETVTLSGTILAIKSIRTRTGKTMQQATFSDGSGLLKISWFNQPFLVTHFQKQPQVSLSGKIKIFAGKPSLSSPKYESIKPTLNDQTISRSSDPTSLIHTGRLVPVYPETAGVSSKWLRSRINALLKALPPQQDFLPPTTKHKAQITDFDWCIRNIHFPNDLEAASQARRRLAFDELFIWQLVAQIRKQNWKGQTNQYQHHFDPETELAPYLKGLPFSLTNDQHQAILDIINDIGLANPMNRLLQGDVGSGKTVVAGAVMYLLAKQGLKSALMAPTEILAHQHAETLTKILSPHGITVAVGTRSRHDELSKADVVVGTQALLFRELPKDLALLVIDEQHRFGVTQRSQLLHLDKPPHLLSMTATPIPRTIALTLYAELDISLIREMPLGRLHIKTWIIPQSKRQKAESWIREQIQNGGQAFVVCPLIEESESDTLTEVKSAEIEYRRLQDHVFPDLKVGLVHGKMKSKEKDAVINDFQQKKTDILVATSVIEVGIDIPNATMMVIEGAERFGLAQLHQLRGRVGRSDKQSYCLLFQSKDNAGQERLQHLESVHSGFDLAEIDLKLRGPGNLYGQQQSGFINLKLASFNDEDLIQQTYTAATALIQEDKTLSKHPHIKSQIDDVLTRLADPN